MDACVVQEILHLLDGVVAAPARERVCHGKTRSTDRLMDVPAINLIEQDTSLGSRDLSRGGLSSIFDSPRRSVKTGMPEIKHSLCIKNQRTQRLNLQGGNLLEEKSSVQQH